MGGVWGARGYPKVTKPYEFIGFEAMDVTKPYESMVTYVDSEQENKI
jgi:hypothetical protein